MRNIILYLEDEANVRKHTVELLRDRGYNVEDFRRIDEAKEFFTTDKDDVVCIITDLNLPDEWLGKYRYESNGGLFSGWVWLQRFVYTEKPNILTIIYSGYTEDLIEWLDSKNQSPLLSKNIICVKKGAEREDGFSGLLTALRKHLPNYKREE